MLDLKKRKNNTRDVSEFPLARLSIDLGHRILFKVSRMLLYCFIDL